MPLIAAFIVGAWMLVSVFVLSLCVAAGRADRALELMVRTPEPEPMVDFVAGFAEPQAAPVAPPVPSRTAIL